MCVTIVIHTDSRKLIIFPIGLFHTRKFRRLQHVRDTTHPFGGIVLLYCISNSFIISHGCQNAAISKTWL